MSPTLRAGLQRELAESKAAVRLGDLAAAFRHLERAHVLSQRFTIWHVAVHWRMLRLGVAARNPKEIVGQILRLLAATVFSRIWVPAGNTGGANVSAFRSMPVPSDLQAMLDDSGEC